MEKQKNFEEALAELEQIVERMEKEKLSLEETVSLYEQGTKAVALCRKLLDEGNAKLLVLSREQGILKEEELQDA